MPCKLLIALCAACALTSASVIPAMPVTYATTSIMAKIANPTVNAVADTYEQVVPASTHSKAIDTPHFSVRKENARISNDVYTTSYVQTFSHAAPDVIKTFSYAAPTPTPIYNATASVYEHHEAVPVVAVYTHAAPAIPKTVSYAAPAVSKDLVAPVSTVAPTAPLVYVHPAPATVNHIAPAAGLVKTIRYSPASEVSHMSFDGFGTHWGF